MLQSNILTPKQYTGAEHIQKILFSRLHMYADNVPTTYNALLPERNSTHCAILQKKRLIYIHDAAASPVSLFFL